MASCARSPKFAEGIERTRVHIPGLCEQEGALVEFRKGRQEDPALIVRLKRFELVRPQAENLQRPKDGRVAVPIPQDPNPGSPMEALRRHVPALPLKQRMARGRQAAKQRGRSAVREPGHGLPRQPEQVHEPLLGHMLQPGADRRHHLQSGVLIPRVDEPARSQSLRQHAPVHEPEVASARLGHRSRRAETVQLAQCFERLGRFVRDRLVEVPKRLDVFRRGRDPPTTDGFHVLCGVLVRQREECLVVAHGPADRRVCCLPED